MLRYVLALLLLQSISWSQSDADVVGMENNNIDSQSTITPNKRKEKLEADSFSNSSKKSAQVNATQTSLSTNPNTSTTPSTVKLDEYFNTWNARKARQGFGFSPLLNLAQYDRWITPKWGFFIGVRYDKSQDNFTETKTTSFNQTSLSLSETVQFAGLRNPANLNIVVGGKNRIWQNDWVQINWGGLLLYTHGTSVTYNTGSLTRSVANVNTPNDYSMTESALGTTSTGIDPKYSLGVKVGSEFYIKWFPNLALCAEIVFLNQLPVKGTTETSTATKTYNVVAGVAQSPTAESYNTSRTFNDYGGSASTSQVGSAYFNIFGANWSIKYVW